MKTNKRKIKSDLIAKSFFMSEMQSFPSQRNQQISRALKSPAFFGMLKTSKVFFMIITLVIAQIAFSVMLAPDVKAFAPGCCERLKDGSYCQNTPDINTDCDSKYQNAPTQCEYTSFCKLGCCYDSLKGECYENTPYSQCVDAVGTFTNQDKACQNEQCSPGCCIIGSQGAITTGIKCKSLASAYNMPLNWNSDITDEFECISAAKSEDKGCCKIAGGAIQSCKFQTRAECAGGEFFKDTLCSSPQLGCPCTQQASTNCVNGKDEVYWFDSCGNIENIYAGDSVEDKKDSWNNGLVLSKENSAGFAGDCNYIGGSKCVIKDSKAQCISLNCPQTYKGTNDAGEGGQQRLNLESWCVYDAPKKEGERSEPVGSRDWLHYCIGGKEYVEPCDDYRGSICVQNNTAITPIGSKTTFSFASCIPNYYSYCQNQTTKGKCTEMTDAGIDLSLHCYWQDGIGCLQKNPIGLNLNSSTSTAACQAGTSVCITNWVKAWRPSIEETRYDWKTMASGAVGECLDRNGNLVTGWMQNANKKCYSAGDCGYFINIVGEKGKQNGSHNFYYGGPDAGFTDRVKNVANLFPWQSYLDTFPKLNSSLTPVSMPASHEIISPTGGVIKTITGAFEAGVFAKAAEVIGRFIGTSGGSLTTGFTPNAAASVATIAALITYMYYKANGYSDAQSALAAAAVGVGTYALTAGVALGPVGWIILTVILVAIEAFREEKSSTMMVFQCLPWQPSAGGAKCEECNKDVMKPCSEYRCKSLGAACELINTPGDLGMQIQGTTGKEKCIWKNPNDVTPPIIESVNATEGYSITNFVKMPPSPGFRIVGTNKAGWNKACLKPFTNFEFTIILDEPGQCKISENSTYKFDDSSVKYIGGSNLFDYKHTERLYFAAANATDTGLPSLKTDGQYRYWIKCRNKNGKPTADIASSAVQFCIDAGPDLTAPEILGTSILNKASITYGINSTYLELYTNEPSNCRWDTIDQSYEKMNYNFSSTGLANAGHTIFQGKQAYKVYTNLTLAKTGANNYYFRCQDKSVGKNANMQSYKFDLSRSASRLKITSVGPAGIVSGRGESIQVELTAVTEAGAEDGKATCYYNTTASNVRFFSTESTSHSQILYLPMKSWTVGVKCEDAAGNIDYKSTSFTVKADTSPPKMTRVYSENGLLKLVTNEDSTCSFSTKSCVFKFEDGTEMTGVGKEHFTDWRTDVVFYVQCKDAFGNSKCVGSVKPYETSAESA